MTASATFDVINPATGAAFATAPAATPEQVDHVVRAAHDAFGNWRRDEDARRAAMLASAEAIDAATADLAATLTAEQGKPLKDAAQEVQAATVWLRYFATLDLPCEIVQDDSTGFAEVHYRPLGVVAAITPWNFPLALAMWKIAPALRAGNTIVIKPSPYTPLATIAMGAIMNELLPAGALTVLTGPDPLGSLLTRHPLAHKISFTGSTATGKRVASDAAADLKRVTLELGGNDPAVVLPDVDVSAIAAPLFWSAFANNGQTCLAVKRVYAHETVHDELVEALAALASKVRVDEGTAADAELGPLNNQPQFARVTALVDAARQAGAKVTAGGHALDRPGYFYAPTILHGLDESAAIVAEEQFGPALPVLSYRSADEAIARANASAYGLTASIWSGDDERAATIAAEIDAGQVTVNGHGTAVRPDLPFGGHKSSGIGVENGRWGLHEFTETQVISGPPRRTH
jgi:acyl-CoA reductase-like NAD-dependent aldehyde dehydrogenase